MNLIKKCLKNNNIKYWSVNQWSVNQRKLFYWQNEIKTEIKTDINTEINTEIKTKVKTSKDEREEKKNVEYVNRNHFFSEEKFKHIKTKVDIENMNSKELLSFISYCNKNKRFCSIYVDITMKYIEMKTIESINLINTDISQNRKNILNPKAYEYEKENKKIPFFQIRDLISVYLNICYMNSYFQLQQKKNLKRNVSLTKEMETKKMKTERKTEEVMKGVMEKITEKEKKKEIEMKEENGIHKSDNDNLNVEWSQKYITMKNTTPWGKRETKELFYNTNNNNNDNNNNTNVYKDVYKMNIVNGEKTTKNSILCREENVSNNCLSNEYIRNIFNLLTVFFLQNINILKEYELCKLFYGYNKSKMWNEQYLNNLILEIIKRIKKIKSYNLYLIFMNCYYMHHIDFLFLKILLITIISNLCKLPCEAICQVLPTVHIFLNNDKMIYKINIFYAKKVASFNQLKHLLQLFKKMIQYNLITQKNIIFSFKKLSSFIQLKTGTIKNVQTHNSFFKNIPMKETSPSEEILKERQLVYLDQIVQNFEQSKQELEIASSQSLLKNQMKTQNKTQNEIKNEIQNEIQNEMQNKIQNEIQNKIQNEININRNVNNIKYNKNERRVDKKNKNDKCGNEENLDTTHKYTVFDIEKEDYHNTERFHIEKIFDNSEALFDLKLIEMHLRHDFTNVYNLLAQEYKNFLLKIRNISYRFDTNLQGEERIYILKKYMKLLNYKFITFIHGPYILHIYFIFQKIYITWKDVWKLYPPYEQNEKRNFEKKKNEHLKKEGFTGIFICHDTFISCQTEEEKMKYINMVLQQSNISKEVEVYQMGNVSTANTNKNVPLQMEFIYT